MPIMSTAGLGPYPYDNEEPPTREPVPRTRILVWVGPSALVGACVGALAWVAIGLKNLI